MELYAYKVSCKGNKDGRSFTLNLKLKETKTLAELKSIIESRSDVTVVEASYVETFSMPPLPESERAYNLYYSGILYLDADHQVPMDVSRQILPLYELEFDSLVNASWTDLQLFLRQIYGDDFDLKYAQLVQAN